MRSNIVKDIKDALKGLLERNMSPIFSQTGGSAGVAPSAKPVFVTLEELAKQPQKMPIVQILLIADTPDFTRNQSYNARVFYVEPDNSIPGVTVTATDEAGNMKTGPKYRMRKFQPQKWVFRFRITSLAERVQEIEDVHTQIQTILESHRTARLKVVRNTSDEAQYEESFNLLSVNGKIVPFDGMLPKSVIEVDVYAYYDTAQPEVKQYTIRKFKQDDIIIN